MMIQIKKLSTKLLIILGVVILSLIVWQVIFSKRVIGDFAKIHNIQTAPQARELLDNGKLKTFSKMPLSQFSNLILDGITVFLFKGDEYAVYLSSYNKDSVDVRLDNNNLHLRYFGRGGADNPKWMPVFVSMPEEPNLVHSIDTDNHGNKQHNILGFKGDKMRLSYGNARIWLNTDISHIKIRQNGGELTLDVKGSDVCVDADSKNGSFRLFDWDSESMNLDLRLNESIGSFAIHPQSKVEKISVMGSLRTHRYLWYGENRNTFEYSRQVDSLIINLTNSSREVERLLLSTNLSGKYEDIQISNNIFIERRDDLMPGRRR